MKEPADQHTKQEAQQRLQTILRGAFSGAPTPLKAIPKRNGESRSLGTDQPRKRRRQRKKRAA